MLSALDSFLGKNPALTQLATSALTGLTQKSAPKIKEVSPPVQIIQTPSANSGMSNGKIAGIAAAVLGVVVLVVVFIKFKGK